METVLWMFVISIRCLVYIPDDSTLLSLSIDEVWQKLNFSGKNILNQVLFHDAVIILDFPS